MDKINDGGPAFPFIHDRIVYPGMTLRDYFAAMALQGILGKASSSDTPLEAAIKAYACADAMITEKNNAY